MGLWPKPKLLYGAHKCCFQLLSDTREKHHRVKQSRSETRGSGCEGPQASPRGGEGGQRGQRGAGGASTSTYLVSTTIFPAFP